MAHDTSPHLISRTHARLCFPLSQNYLLQLISLISLKHARLCCILSSPLYPKPAFYSPPTFVKTTYLLTCKKGACLLHCTPLRPYPNSRLGEQNTRPPAHHSTAQHCTYIAD